MYGVKARIATCVIKIFLAGLYSAPASALEWLPEFQSIPETEVEDFETPGKINPEFQSDILTFTKPPEWEYLWLSSDMAFDLSVGSTGARHFMTANRLKLRPYLSEHFQFRFTYLDESSRERQAGHHILEAVFWPLRFVGISLYGEPHMEKRRDDTGIAVLVRPSPRHEIRLFNTFVDVARLARSDRPDTFDEDFLPYARGLVGRWWSDPEKDPGEFLEYAVRWEPRTRWIFPEREFEYAYWKGFFSLFGRKHLTGKWTGSVRLQYDRKFESKTVTASTSLEEDAAWRFDRFFLTLRTEHREFIPGRDWNLRGGLQFAFRRWERDFEAVGYYRDWLPFVWVDFPAFGEGPLRDRFHVGCELTWHSDSGLLSLIPDSDVYLAEFSELHGRLNLMYEFRWGAKAAFRLVATADLDEFGTRRTWEGGNGQFRLSF